MFGLLFILAAQNKKLFYFSCMALNYIWVGFFLIGFIVAIIRVLGYYFRAFFEESFGIIFDKADLAVFSEIVNSTFSMAETSVNIAVISLG